MALNTAKVAPIGSYVNVGVAPEKLLCLAYCFNLRSIARARITEIPVFLPIALHGGWAVLSIGEKHSTGQAR